MAVHSPADEPYPLNTHVTHNEWGGGTVMRYEGDKVTVLFDTVGYKSLPADCAGRRIVGRGLTVWICEEE